MLASAGETSGCRTRAADPPDHPAAADFVAADPPDHPAAADFVAADLDTWCSLAR
ncbi:MAG: hypothetical protein ABJD68_09360 [Nakamurella sp.]